MTTDLRDFVFALSLFVLHSRSCAIAVANGSLLLQQKSSDESALMNIWNYQIERKVKTSIKYKQQDLAVWEEADTTSSPAATRRYYVTPPATLLPHTAACHYITITDAYEVTYDIQLWEKDLPSAVIAGLKALALEIREDQIHPLPFYQARIIWNNPEQELKNLKLSTAWMNNLKQQQVYTFRVAAENNQSCVRLADTIRQTPEHFVRSLQLQFTVSAAKVDSKVLNVKSEHVASSQLASSLISLPGATGTTRYMTSSDYNRMLWQIANEVVASEVISGDYVDADDELSLKDTISQMFKTQTENTAQFDEKMWDSVFWDPLNARPDKITSELKKLVFINKTDDRAYRTSSDTSSTEAKATILKIFSGDGKHTSASSITTDELRNRLLINNVESEIQGEKFVPKKLDLTRLNTNEFSRRDVLTTKRVRVKQVQIGGVLQIGIGGNATSAEDENDYLRQQVTDLRDTLKQIRSDFDASLVGLKRTDDSLQGTVSGLQGAVNGLQTSESAIRIEVADLRLHSHNHIDSCEVIEIAHRACAVTNFECPPGKVLKAYIRFDVAPHYCKKSITCC